MMNIYKIQSTKKQKIIKIEIKFCVSYLKELLLYNLEISEPYII